MELSSPAFDNDQPIPDEFTAKGTGTSPPLIIKGAPPATQSLAIIMHDPDAPGRDFTHWTIWNISGTASILPGNHVPSGAIQGITDYGRNGYGPPAPPSGTHRYVFELYALNSQLTLEEGADLAALHKAMEGRILANTQLTGTVSA